MTRLDLGPARGPFRRQGVRFATLLVAALHTALPVRAKTAGLPAEPAVELRDHEREWGHAEAIIDELEDGTYAGGDEVESLRVALATQLRHLGTLAVRPPRENRPPGPHNVAALPYWEWIAFCRHHLGTRVQESLWPAS